MLAGIGSMHALVPPQITRDAGGRRDGELVARNVPATPRSAASGQAPRSSASARDAASASRRRCLNMRRFAARASALSNGMPLFCRQEWKPIAPSPTERSRMAEYFAVSMRRRRVVDEILQHVVEHAQHVFDEARLARSIVPRSRSSPTTGSTPRCARVPDDRVPVGSRISLHRFDWRTLRPSSR